MLVWWSHTSAVSFDLSPHVKAHAGHPWNELADVLAKSASKGLKTTNVASQVVPEGLDNTSVRVRNFSFAQYLPDHGRAQYPSAGPNEWPSWELPSHSIASWYDGTSNRAIKKLRAVNVIVISANVLSMLQKKMCCVPAGLNAPSRIATLADLQRQHRRRAGGEVEDCNIHNS